MSRSKHWRRSRETRVVETTEELQKRIRVAGDLHSVVRTMKGMAAVNIRQYELAVEALAHYSRTVELGFQALLRERPQALSGFHHMEGGAPGALVFGSDQGMCGQLNRDVAERFVQHFREPKSVPAPVAVGAIGARVAMELEAEGYGAEHSLALPGSAEQLASKV
ncbi:MAG TPA: F0F1 ATP synthase subunit gamma, partial [Candidatus Hydrogenedentes bacterium]|nr:F0F1 ATP synthase subunit gamma [Candidatus Hydrogenedentota bacterium]